MYLAGVNIALEDVMTLVALLRAERYSTTADTLERGIRRCDGAVGLTIRERTAILDVLDDPPDGLAQLRGVLLAEHTWRIQHGLAPDRVI
jgi:hypothetical protein